MVASAIIPLNEAAAIDAVKSLRNIVHRLRFEVLKEGEDFGVIPGTGDDPTLLLPGMEKLMRALNAVPEYIERRVIVDYDKPLFHYEYECRLIDAETGVAIPGGRGLGLCHSYESAFRWRWVSEDRLPVGVDKPLLETRNSSVTEFAFAVEKGETTGKYGKPAAYWQSFKDEIANGTAKEVKRKTASGKVMDAWEIGGLVYKVANPEIYDQINAIMKRAKKRALGDAIKGAANVSEFFTVDLEDFTPYQMTRSTEDVVEGSFTEIKVVNKTTGEIVEDAPLDFAPEGHRSPPATKSDQPQPASKVEPWTREEAIEWVNLQLKNGHTDTELRTALLINQSWMEWDGSKADADIALANFVQREMDIAKAEKADAPAAP